MKQILCVIASGNGVLDRVYTFMKTGSSNEAVKAAEDKFAQEIKEIDPDISDSDISVCIEDGWYGSPNGRDDVWLCWSDVNYPVPKQTTVKERNIRCQCCGLENVHGAFEKHVGGVRCGECSKIRKYVPRTYRLANGCLVNHALYCKRRYFEAEK